jgi:hypothetical protein
LTTLIAETEVLENPKEKKGVIRGILNINSPIYATIAKLNHATDEKIQILHKAILQEALHVALMDDYFETNDEKAKLAADSAREKVDSLLPPNFIAGHNELRSRLITFFDEEKVLASQLFRDDNDDTFLSIKEIEDHTFKKSTDTYLYENILRAFVEIPENIIEALLCRQLYCDKIDDWTDLEDDFRNKIPNPLLCRLRTPSHAQHYDHAMFHLTDPPNLDQKTLERLIKSSGVMDEHSHFLKTTVDKLGVRLHPKYQWITSDVINEARVNMAKMLNIAL